MKSCHHSSPVPSHQRGLSLIEMMIAMTIGLIILAGMAGIFVSSSQAHRELEKASRQIENGRYATASLSEEIQLAGYYSDYMPVSSAVWTTPDPCTTTLASMGFAAGSSPSIPVGIQGYDSGTGLPGTCDTVLTNRQAGTDVLVVRRVGTTPVTKAAAEAANDGEYYLQVSNCADSPAEAAFVFSTTPADFVLHGVRPSGTPPSCLSGDTAPLRRYMVRIYYVATCDVCSPSDNIPTLKMAELTKGGSFTVRTVSEGIENVQFEYGIDTAGNDGIPDEYAFATDVATGEWRSVVAVKAFVLARNDEVTQGHKDGKTYILCSDRDLAGCVTVSGNNDAFRRHVYLTAARANNISGRKQQ